MFCILTQIYMKYTSQVPFDKKNHHWFREWLGRQQAITGTNDDPVYWCHVASLGHNELSDYLVTWQWHSWVKDTQVFGISLEPSMVLIDIMDLIDKICRFT